MNDTLTLLYAKLIHPTPYFLFQIAYKVSFKCIIICYKV